MFVATLTSQGRITIPAKVRAALGLRAGQKVGFVTSTDGFKLVALGVVLPTLHGRFAGRVKKPVSIAEMDAAIAAGATERM